MKTLIFVQVCTEIQIYFSNRVYSKHWNIGLGLKNVCVIKEENQFALIGRGRRSWFIVSVGKDFH